MKSYQFHCYIGYSFILHVIAIDHMRLRRFRFLSSCQYVAPDFCSFNGHGLKGLIFLFDWLFATAHRGYGLVCPAGSCFERRCSFTRNNPDFDLAFFNLFGELTNRSFFVISVVHSSTVRDP